jgi:DNA-binding protein YbaB
MAREIDEAWIDEAIERYRSVETRRAEFEQTLTSFEVAVRSPDEVVEVVVTADGTIRDVRIRGSQRLGDDALARSVRDAVAAAADAAHWARQKLHAELFGAYRPLD